MIKKANIFVTIMMLIVAGFTINSCNKMEDNSVNTPEDFKLTKVEKLYLIKKINNISTKAVAIDGKTWTTGQTIRIKFINSDNEVLKGKVKTYAEEWLQYANLEFEWIEDDRDADVKIGFEWGDDSPYITYSTIGNECIEVPQDEASLNLVGLEDETDDTVIRAEVLKGFGFVLGLGFEHKSPSSDVQFKTSFTKVQKNQIIGFFGMAFEDIQEKIMPHYIDATNYTEYDPLSIMRINIPGAFLVNPPQGIISNLDLSEKDKEFIAQLYPYPNGCVGEWKDLAYWTRRVVDILPTSVTSGSFGASCKGADGRLYFASTNNGIWRLEHDGSFMQIINNLNVSLLGYMVLGPDGRIYIGSNKGVHCIETNNAVTPIIIDSGGTGMSQSYSYTWKDNELYFSTFAKGIWKLDEMLGTASYFCRSATCCGWIAVGQDGKFYSGTGLNQESNNGIFRTDGDVLAEVVPSGTSIFRDAKMGTDNKLYFLTNVHVTNPPLNNVEGIWRLDDDNVIRHVSGTYGSIYDLFVGADGYNYFLGGGDLYVLEDNNMIKGYYAYGRQYLGVNIESRVYLFYTGSFYRFDNSKGIDTRYPTEYHVNNHISSILNIETRPLVDSTGTIYVCGYNGIQKYVICKERRYATNFMFNNVAYSLPQYVRSIGAKDLNEMNDEEFDAIVAQFLEHVKSLTGCASLTASNSVFK